jgi:hypothetical protein
MALGQLCHIEEARAAPEKAKTWWGPGYDPGIPPAWKRTEDHELVLEGPRKADWAAGVLVMLPVLAFTFFVRNYLVNGLMTVGVKEYARAWRRENE